MRLVRAAPILAFLGLPVLGTRFATEPPVAHTGGFGEASCQTCHFDSRPNEPGGRLAIDGAPPTYTAGEAYRLVIRVSRPGMAKAGFQLSARWAEGDGAGQQAGTFRTLDGRVSVTEAGTGVQYASHNATSSTLEQKEVAEWSIEWTAPTAGGRVLVHVAGNAADGDSSPFGDFIYTDSLVLTPVAPAEAVRKGSR